MLNRLGLTGLLGVVFMLGGVALIGWADPRIAAGVALVVAGLGFVAHGLVKSMLGAFGMA